MKCPPGTVAVWYSMEKWALGVEVIWVWNKALSVISGYLVSYSNISDL